MALPNEEGADGAPAPKKPVILVKIRTVCPCGKDYWSKEMKEGDWDLPFMQHELNKVSQHG